MRVAVVDIGSNSTRLLLADVDCGKVRREQERRSTVTRLGAGVDAGKTLARDSIERVFAVLDDYRDAIDLYGADTSIAILTSAVRDATNGAEFAQAVEDRFGLRAHVLAGEEEARLTFLGATSERDPGEGTPTLVADIGGGSTELVIGSRGSVEFHVSTQAGVVRQTERHLHTDPPAQAELDALRDDVRAVIAGGVPASQRRAASYAIAVAGTATSLAAVSQRLNPYDPNRVHGHGLATSECEELRRELAALPLAERRRVVGLQPDRAPTIVAGVVILCEVLRMFGLDQVEVSEHDIMRGAALALA